MLAESSELQRRCQAFAYNHKRQQAHTADRKKRRSLIAPLFAPTDA